jgi:hypothetical protein
MLGNTTRLGLFGYGVSRNTSFLRGVIVFVPTALADVSVTDGVVTGLSATDGVVTVASITEWPA